jgi:hypothetical protein
MRLGISFLVSSLLLGVNLAQAEPPTAQSAVGCMPWQKAVLNVRQTNPDAAIVDVAEGTEAQSLLAVLNSLPPTSSVGGDAIAVVFEPRGDNFLFVIGLNDCAVGVMQVERSAIEKMVGISI